MCEYWGEAGAGGAWGASQDLVGVGCEAESWDPPGVTRVDARGILACSRLSCGAWRKGKLEFLRTGVDGPGPRTPDTMPFDFVVPAVA